MNVDEVREVQLPGVGVRLELTTQAGEEVAVVVHRGGRRELMVYDQEDPDVCTTLLHLSIDESRTVGEMLGGSKVSEVTSEVVQQVEGLTIDWLTVAPAAAFAGKSLGDGMFRTRTGVSIVAVIRGRETIAGPGPDHILAAGDVAVAVGTREGLDELRNMLSN
ncbi:MAG: cation:proton antiporter regulatory subunit [Actinomycetota bacterium]